MTTSGGADLVRRLYSAFGESDHARLLDCFADDVHLVQTGKNQLAGHFRGRDEVVGHFADIARLTDRMSMEPEDVLEGNAYVAAINRMTVEINGDSRVFHVIHVFHIEDGRITRMRSVPEDPYGLDNFFGDAVGRQTRTADLLNDGPEPAT